MVAMDYGRPTVAKSKPMKSMKLPPEINLAHVGESIRDSIRQLKPFRENFLEIVRQVAGSQYGEGATAREVPFNILGLWSGIMARSLVAKTPQVMLSTDDREQAPAVLACETWANEEADRMDLGTVLQRATTDALYCMGIVKVGLAHPGDAAARGWGLRAGTPFAQCISLEDYVVDLHAKDRNEVAFEGHRYRIPLAAAKGMFRRAKGDDPLVGEEDRDYNDDGDERLTMLQRGATVNCYEVEEMITFWEIYLPRHRLVLTFLDQDTTGFDAEQGLLQVKKWIGPPTGPYHVLGLGTVSGNLIPKAPGMDLIILQKAINRCWRKLIEDTDRWKSILLVPSQMDTDATAISEARNGTAIKCDARQGELKETVFGGPGQGVLLMADLLQKLFDFMAGNLSAIGGLAPQSKTASQDKMLAESSSRTVGDMQDTTIRWVSRVFKALHWYYWKHPEKVMASEFKAPGSPEYGITRRVYPGGAEDEMGRPRPLRRDGKMPKVRVDPYSLAHKTPETRMAFLDATVASITPMMPLLQQQGVMFDGAKYMQMKAKFGQEPEIAEIFTVQEPMEPEGTAHDGPKMPANTSREYIRRSVGADSAAGQDAQRETMMEAGGGGGSLNAVAGG